MVSLCIGGSGVRAGTGTATATATATNALGTATADLRIVETDLPGNRKLATRVLVAEPIHGPANASYPVLVLLHGLGETGDQRVGARAWVDRYGLATAYE